MHDPSTYIPTDRRVALSCGTTLPDRCTGAVLFADISGFTPLAHAFATELGPQRGAEALLSVINSLYQVLITPLHHYGGSVISFAGDAITCWLDARDGPAESRAVATALAMQTAMSEFAQVRTPAGTLVEMSVKVAVAAGSTRRFLVGDPDIMLLDTLAGATLARMADAEHYAERGDVIVSAEVAEALGAQLSIVEWRETFAVVASLKAVVAPMPTDVEIVLSEDTLRSWMLPAMYKYFQTGQTEIGSLRPVTPFFIKFSGIDYDGDDDAEVKLDAYVRHIQQHVQQHGGNLLQLIIGDKGAYIYVVFGAPVAHEDDAARAMRAALAISDLPSDLAYITGVQMGLTRGNLWAGDCGAATRQSYAVMGSDVNLSARLMGKAQAGQILVSERLAATPDFKFQHMGDWHYKGFAKMLPTFELCSAGLVSTRNFEDVMVGRETELQQLVDFAHPLTKGQLAGVAILYGAAGVGKSHLSYAFSRALGLGVRRIAGQCDPILREAFNPFVYFLKEYFGQIVLAAESENKANFEQQLAQLLADLSANLSADQSDFENLTRIRDEVLRTRSFLGALLGLYWPNSLYEKLEGKGRYENTMIAIKTLLLAESCLHPVVLELEDGHWFDEASQEMLLALSRNINKYPLLIIVTSRYADDGSKPEFALSHDMPVLSLDLDTLATASLAQQAENILDGPVSDKLLALLQEKTQGNPFFVQQILYYLEENDLLQHNQNGNWCLKSRAFDIPTSINAILISRLDRLAQQVKEVVQAAAVLGREFEVHLLTQMLTAHNVPLDVAQAEQEQIWTSLADLRYIFKHALLRDAAYEMQLRTRLRELHRLAAESLERLYAADLPPHYGEIAHHYEVAYQHGLTESREAAVAYLRLAGEQAAADYENAAAVDYFSRALTLTPEHAAPDSVDTTERFNLLLGREAVYHLQGAWEAQTGDLDVMALIAQSRQQPREQAVIALRWARYANNTSDYPQAIAQAQVAIAAVQASGDVELEAAGQLAWGIALRRQGKYAAAEDHLKHALALADAAERHDLEVDGLRYLGIVTDQQGDYAGARNYHGRSLSVAREIGDRRGESRCLNNLGVDASKQGDYAGARGYYEQSLSIAREIGDRMVEGSVLNNLGTISDTQGDYTGAWGYYEQSLPISREIGSQLDEGIVLNNLGNVSEVLGDYARAQEYYARSLAIAREIGDREGEGYVLTSLGNVLTGLDKPAEAVVLLQQAISLRRELSLLPPMVESQATLARAYLAQQGTSTSSGQVSGQAVSALPQDMVQVEEILAYLDAGGNFDGTEQPLRIYLTCYQVLQAAGDSRAVRVLQIAHAVLQEQAARIPDESTRRSFLENVPWHREIVAAWHNQEKG